MIRRDIWEKNASDEGHVGGMQVVPGFVVYQT